MYTKFIPKNIQEKLKARERALSYKKSGVNESLNPGDSTVKAIKPNELQSRSVFVRMCSNKASVDNIVISGGKLDDLDGKLRFGIDNLYEDKKNSGRRTPVAGIKNIEVSYKGSYKAIREATVNWTVGSLDELDELTPYFLTPGKTVILDWGWVNKNSKSFNQNFDAVPFITLIQNEDLGGGIKKYVVDQNIFTNAQARVQKMGGDYDAIGGKISNFESTMRADGGFDCVTKITALGSTLFSKPIDKPTDQISIIPKPKKTDEKKDENQQNEGEKEEDKKSVKTEKGTDNLINAIINLKQIIIKKVFNWTTKEPKLRKKDTILFGKDYKVVGAPQAFEDNHSVYLPEGENYGIAVDNKENAQVCWMNIEGEENFFVKWGWMEDQLMNRYLAFDAGEDTGAGIKITFRSIKTKIDGEGKPILNTIYKEKLDNQNNNAKTTAATAATYSSGGSMLTPTDRVNIYVVKSGDNLSAIATNNNTTVAYLLVLNPSITNASQISVGQEIILPPSSSVSGSEREQRLQEAAAEQNDAELAASMEARRKFLAKMDSESIRGGSNFTAEQIAADDAAAKQVALNEFRANYEGVLPYFDNISSIHAHEFEKEATTIKNNKSLLYPINPFAFWSQELLPAEDRIKPQVLNPIANVGRASASDGGAGAQFYMRWQGSPIFAKNTFTPKSDGDYIEHLGVLRNMWVNIEEIQKAFGIDLTSKSEAKANPPGTFERGIESLLVSLNKNFYGIWDFELAVDPYDSTNMGVLDKKVNSIEGDSLKYTTFKNDDIEDKEGKKSHVVQDAGIYKFPSFKAGSIVKNQNLSFRIPDSMALTILYGSNKPGSETTNNASFNNPDIMKVFNRMGGPEYEDMFLKDMMPANVSKDEAATAQNVGSINTNPNSKIIKGEGLTLSGLEPWIKEWTGEEGKIKDPEPELRNAKTKYSFTKINGKDNIVLLKEKTMEVSGLASGRGQSLTLADTRISEEDRYTIENEKPYYYHAKDSKNRLLMIPDVAKLIRSRLNGSIKIENQKSLKVDTIIPAELTLEVDGIGGMVPGDVIHTHYIQKEYGINIKDSGGSLGPYTYFQVVGLNQKVDSSGWTTELLTKMRINHIPDKGDLRVEEDYTGEPLPDVQRPSIPVPTDDEDIADDVTLDDLDFDDFEEWEAPPPPPKPVKITTKISGTGIGHGNPKLQKIVQRVIPAKRFETSVVENQTVEVTFGNIPPPPIARPSIPVPTDDEDIADDVTLDVLEFDDFDPWEAPPVPIEKKLPPKPSPNIVNTMPIQIIDRRMQEILNGNARKRKINPPPPLYSTYRGTFVQNDEILYKEPYKPEWRPEYTWADGVIRNYTVQRHRDTGAQLDYLDRPQPAGFPKVKKAKKGINTRRDYWNRNIEQKTERKDPENPGYGISNLPS